MFNSFNNTDNSTFREICEDAPCCGCCGHIQEATWDEEDRYDFSGEDWNRFDYSEEDHEEDHEEGDEDRYLDASWEDRFEMDY
jgi:hypothetical protein